ncbi:MAG: glutamate-5-semialdehyde dehydrogenase [Acidobacteria bacterium]|nr:glutamate-5-semialdehyde dehydrogenase [Acidobacteriota bacterium]
MVREMGLKARAAARVMATLPTEVRSGALGTLARLLEESRGAIEQANGRDVALARASGLDDALIDRLTLDGARIGALARDVRALERLPDPVGERFDRTVLPNGLRLCRQRVPLGVLAVIYESRPNVTIDVSALSIKTGNSVILRGGKETLHSNRALVALVREALGRKGLPQDAVQFVGDPDRARVLELLDLGDLVDVIIPRGGANLHRFCREHSRIPVITGGIGICHIYVDASADIERAIGVIHNAKTQRPSVCNALDTVLVHRSVAADALPRIVEALAPAGVVFRADPGAFECLAGHGAVRAAGPEDFDTEWMSLVLGLKVVGNIDEAIAHTNAHSMGHSDSILTGDPASAERWIREVDSAAVYVNASTRFTDGGQFGLGAEVAISTQRLHARGPMGLRELTTYKWVGEGDYHTRS